MKKLLLITVLIFGHFLSNAQIRTKINGLNGGSENAYNLLMDTASISKPQVVLSGLGTIKFLIPKNVTATSIAAGYVVTDTAHLFVSQSQKNYWNSKINTNQSIAFTGVGDVSATASGTTSLTPSFTVNGLKGVPLPTLANGLFRYNAGAFTWDGATYLTSAAVAAKADTAWSLSKFNKKLR